MISRKGALILAITLIAVSFSFRSGECADEDWEYHDSSQIAGILLNTSIDNPDICEYTTSRELLGTRDIPGGRTIPILFVGNRTEERPWVMLIGAHHGDEPDSAEAVLAFTMHLIDSRNNGDIRALNIIENINLAILPVVNPYGLDMNSRVDENGEDPNRDYPFETAGVTSTTDGIPLTTAGAYTVHNLAMMYPFSIAISFHSGSKGIFYPWGAPGVGVRSPDHICFEDIGEALTAASGDDMVNGPANDYSYVAELDGAFDDHLYGSMFLMDRVYSPSMQLPWSVFTSTVELEVAKGQRPELLGGLEGLWDDPVSDTGTVARGVRICYSACQMAEPVMDFDHTFSNGTLHLEATVTGALSLSSPVIMIDGEVVPTPGNWSRGPYLPEWKYEADLEVDLDGGGHLFTFSAIPDPDWKDRMEDSYPLIIPQSLIAGSRDDSELFFAGILDVEGKDVVEPVVNGSVVILDEGMFMEASWNHTVDLSLDWEEFPPDELVIVVQLDDWTKVTRYQPFQFSKGTGTYSFDMIRMEGEAILTVNLSFAEGDVIDSTDLTVIPALGDIDHYEVDGSEDLWKMVIPVEGGTGQTPVLWGLSREEDLPWDSSGWSIPPGVVVSSGYGTIDIDVDLSGFDGVLYFRVVTSRALEYDPAGLERSFPVILEGGIDVVPPVISVINDTVRIGPALVVSRMDGLRSLDEFNDRVDYGVTIQGPAGNITSLKLEWMQLSWLDDDQVRELEYMAAMQGLGPGDVEGAFFGEFEMPEKNGDYHFLVEVSGTATLGRGRYENFNLSISLGPVTIGSDEGDEEDQKEFPWILFFFLVIVAFLILAVTYFRYESHSKEPEPEDENKVPDRRRDRRASPRENSRRAGDPPWR